MSSVARIHSVRIGPHTAALALDTASSDMEYIALDVETGLPDPGYNYNERMHPNLKNTSFSSLQGTKKLEIPDLVFPATGLASGGAGNAVASSTLAIDLDGVLNGLIGTASTANGDTTDASDAGTGAQVILDGNPGVDPAGEAFLIKGTTSGKYVARECLSTSSATVTLDRALTTDANAADTPDEGEVVYASRTWTLVPATTQVIPFYLDTETVHARRLIYGCYSNIKWSFPRGGYARITLTGIQCNDWAAASPASPTVTYGTTGGHIQCWDMPLWIGADQYMAYDVEFDLGLQWAERPNDGGPNNRSGMVRVGAKPVVTFKVPAGAITTPLEMTDANLETLRGDVVRDLAFQVGRDPGAAMYVRSPSARLTIDRAIENGLEIFNVRAESTEDSEHYCKIHIF